MLLLRLLSRGIACFHERLIGDKSCRHTAAANTIPTAPPVTADCLVVGCPESEQALREVFPLHTIVLCEGSRSLLDSLDRLEHRPLELLIASETIHSALLSNIDHLRQLATLCLRKLWLHGPHSWLAEQQLRVALHRVGFYEVAHCIVDKADARYERSSVGLRPDGQYQITDRLPGVAQEGSVDWLLASRIPLLETEYLPWKWIYGEGVLADDGYFSAANDKDSILSVTGKDTSANPPDGVRISAQFRWRSPLTSPAIGSLVGCYYGPGDSHMYLAMLEPQTQTQFTTSLWRNTGTWEQISKKLVSLPHAKYAQLNGQTSVEVTMEITEDRLYLYCGTEVVLIIEDDSIPRNLCHGARIFGSQLQIGKIVAWPL